MSLQQDFDQICEIVLGTDPSFRAVHRLETERHIEHLRQRSLSGPTDTFLRDAMRLLALPNNGHTRLIPNDAISVVPLRFVTIGKVVQLRDAASAFKNGIGGALLGINGVPIDVIENASLPLLAGTRQRKRVIGPILYTWPAALRHLGVPLKGNRIEYQLQSKTREIINLRVEATEVVDGATFYPRNEHGRTRARWTPSTYVEVEDFGQSGTLLSLPSFFDPHGKAFPRAIANAANEVRSRQNTPLILDLRGNTGGDFLLTLPLIDAISTGASTGQVAVLVDKFTFSAAIVFVAILKHRLGKRLTIIGEEMGDGLTFFAEGGSITLPTSGATVRYATAFHDWTDGTTDQTTPAEIAAHLAPVGRLDIDHAWTADADDVETRDRLCRDILATMTSP